MRHPLRVCLRQTEKLKTLCEELDRMQATALDMHAHIHHQRGELAAELHGAHKYKSWYTKKKESALKKVISQNVVELFNKFLDEQNYKPKIELEEQSEANFDLTEYVDG